MQFLVGVFVGFLAATIGLINLDDAPQLIQLIAASLVKPSQKEPCGFLSDADLLASCMDEMPLRAVTTRYLA